MQGRLKIKFFPKNIKITTFSLNILTLFFKFIYFENNFSVMLYNTKALIRKKYKSNMETATILIIFVSSLLLGITSYSIFTAFGPASKNLRDPFEEHED